MITKEMREVAWREFKLSQEADDEYIPLVKALEAVVPMIRNATLEEAAKVVEDAYSYDCDLARVIRALASPSVAGER